MNSMYKIHLKDQQLHSGFMNVILLYSDYWHVLATYVANSGW